MKQVFKIDNEGFYVEPVIIEDGELEGCISTPIPDGLFKAKWNGQEWLESMSQEEIDAIRNKPSGLSENERITELESVVNMLLLGGI